MENKKDMIIKKLYFSTFIVVIDSCSDVYLSCSAREAFYDLDQQDLFVL